MNEQTWPTISERFAKPRPQRIRYVEDRLGSMMREIGQLRSHNEAWEIFDEKGHVDYADESPRHEYQVALRLADAYYRQFRASDETVAPLSLYYGSMWLSRAILAISNYSESFGDGLYTHGVEAHFPTIELDQEFAEELDCLPENTQVTFKKSGRLSILSQTLAGDDLADFKCTLLDLFRAVPDLDPILSQGTFHARIHVRSEDAMPYDITRGMHTRSSFDYRLTDQSNPLNAPANEFSEIFPLWPAFADRNVYVGSRQVTFEQRGEVDGEDLRSLSMSTPQGPYLECRLPSGMYIPEIAVHLAIQHVLSELVRYHAYMWLPMLDNNSQSCYLIRQFIEISSLKFPNLVLNEMSGMSWDFVRR